MVLRLTCRLRALLTAVVVPATLGLVSGCLLLAEPPHNQVGEECKESKHCPSYGYCAHLDGPSGPGICLPDEEECNQELSPQCEGYACEVELGYCHRSCNSFSDCAAGYTCDFDYKSGDGRCVPESD